MSAVGLDVLPVVGRGDGTALTVTARRGVTGGVGGVAKPPEMAGISSAAVAGRQGACTQEETTRQLGCSKYIAWGSYFMRVAKIFRRTVMQRPTLIIFASLLEMF
jgi:hypothetical protein